jgi:3-hydroxyacyl-[acyl-carrier-protein] dehydratase
MDIYQAIPHRPPFLFIDEIIEITETGAKARRLVRAEEPQFEGHYPGNPIMPGVLLCEAVFQTAAVFMSERMRKEEGVTALERTPILARIGEAKFKRIVRPGDLIDLEVSYKESLGKFHFMKGKVSCGGKVVLTVEYALAMVEEQAEG